MDDVLPVRIGQGLGHPGHDRKYFRHWKQVAVLAEVHQILALEELHRDVSEIVLLAGVEDGDDILVLQASRGLGLAEKPFPCVRQLVAFELLAERHGLDCHDPADLRVLAQVDHPHRAFAQLFIDLIAAKHRLFNRAAVKQHGAARMRAAATQNHRFRQVPGAVQLRLQVFVVLLPGGHVFIDRLRLVELALALEIERKVVQVLHQRIAHWHAPEAVERRVQLSLTLQRKSHHPVGFGGLFIRLEFAGLRHQEPLGGECQVTDHQQRSRENQLQPERRPGQQPELGAQQTGEQDRGDRPSHAGRNSRQAEHQIGGNQHRGAESRQQSPAGLHDEMLAENAGRRVGQHFRGRQGGITGGRRLNADTGGRRPDQDDLVGVFGRRNLARQHVVERIHRKRRLAVPGLVELRQHAGNVVGPDAQLSDLHRLT